MATKALAKGGENRPEGGGTAEPFAAPPPIIQGYKILREIHRGGQGVVYQAVQDNPKRKVAIKVILEGGHASPSSRRRFEREIDLVAHLRHSSIITIHNSGVTDGGLQFYVMDYIRGLPLHRYVSEKKLTLEKTLELFSSVCDAVQYAHQRGVIHRDLKPSNILVDADGKPRVLDFGLAKSLAGPLDASVSITQRIVGTLPYMSPEQAGSNPDEIDTRTDVYALGVILYQLLTGAFPYPVTGPDLVVLGHIAETPPTPPTRTWTIESGVPRRSTKRLRHTECPIDDEVQTIVLKTLTKERERRYQSAGELGRDIGRYLAHEPIEAKADSRWYLLRKTLRRHKALAAAVMMSVMFGVGFGVTMTLLYQQASGERDEQRQRAEAWAGLLEGDVMVDPIKPTTILTRFGDNADFKVFHTFPQEAKGVMGVAFVDPDGMSGNGDELVVAGTRWPLKGELLFAFDLQGNKRWSIPLGSTHSWPDCLPRPWSCQSLTTANLDGEKGDELVVVATDTKEYPTRISIIKARDNRAEVISTFWHYGNIAGLLVEKDYFGKDRPAIIAWGFNNKLDGFGNVPSPDYEAPDGEDTPRTKYNIVSVVMVLDPARMNGLSPPRSNRLADLKGDRPFAYAFLNLPCGQNATYFPERDTKRVHPKINEQLEIQKVSIAQRGVGGTRVLRLECTVSGPDESDEHSRPGALIQVDPKLGWYGASPLSNELIGSEEEYWLPYWCPIIQDYEYVTAGCRSMRGD